MGTPDAFFVPDGERLVATEHTRGPWSHDHQHGGPPSALLVRAFERRLAGLDGGLPGAPPEPAEIARLTVEFVRPVPIGPLAIETEVVRAGRQVQALSGRILCGGTEVCTATALGIRRTSLNLPASLPPAPPAPPPPERSAPFQFPFFRAAVGYHTALEGRLARGTFGAGACAVWMRMRHPLVPGEAPSPLQRVAIAADSGNGVSLVLDPTRWTFVNPDLTIYSSRPLEGEWVCLDATTTALPSGLGLAESALHDPRGPVGRSLQSLVVAKRRPT